MPYRYSSDFRRKVLDLLTAGRSIASIALDLGVSSQPIFNWRRQEMIDTGQAPGLSSPEQAELFRRRLWQSVLLRALWPLRQSIDGFRDELQLRNATVRDAKDAKIHPCS